MDYNTWLKERKPMQVRLLACS